jgi:hypothetical protein
MNSMKAPASARSTIVSDKRSRVGRINTTAHSSSAADTNYIEMSITQRFILSDVKSLIGTKLDYQRVRTNYASGKFESHRINPLRIV